MVSPLHRRYVAGSMRFNDPGPPVATGDASSPGAGPLSGEEKPGAAQPHHTLRKAQFPSVLSHIYSSSSHLAAAAHAARRVPLSQPGGRSCPQLRGDSSGVARTPVRRGRGPRSTGEVLQVPKKQNWAHPRGGGLVQRVNPIRDRAATSPGAPSAHPLRLRNQLHPISPN